MIKILLVALLIINIPVLNEVKAADELVPELLIIGNISRENFSEVDTNLRYVINKEVDIDVTSFSSIGFCSKKGMTSSGLKRLVKYGNKECPNIYKGIKNAKVITLSTSGTEFTQLNNSVSIQNLYQKADLIKERYIVNINEIIVNIRKLNKDAIILIPKITMPFNVSNKYNFIVSGYIKSWNKSLERISESEKTIVLYENQTLKKFNLKQKLE
ncbi:MAG: hypothetical protein K0S34_2481 [Bacillales bacterium]|jgi:hypothetical protein|nr:hypothetical protein [Bacillales bacterium]